MNSQRARRLSGRPARGKDWDRRRRQGLERLGDTGLRQGRGRARDGALLQALQSLHNRPFAPADQRRECSTLHNLHVAALSDGRQIQRLQACAKARATHHARMP
ncbi:MAG: hypothetical protein ACREFO_00180, partial [Acetobacteraceae bacterium]